MSHKITIYCAQKWDDAHRISHVIEDQRSPKEICKHLDNLLAGSNRYISFSCITDVPVNHIGHLVANHKIDSWDITVYYYENGVWQTCDGYDYEGILVAWPYGYFEVGED